MTLYLVSKSPRRADILKAHHIRFEIAENKLEKETPATVPYVTWIVALAQAKVSASIGNLKGLILGSDTAVIAKNRVMGKPESLDAAIDGLMQLSGTVHTVLSAYALYDTATGEWNTSVEENRVHFAPFNRQTATRYATECNVMDKAGGYGIQDLSPYFKATIQKGYLESIMGLPIKSLLPLLHNAKL
ncbi:MAG: Maf family protein [bacterium]|nr:Maf family protein [bacterium]